ncbi:hypothetical protein ACTFIZ_001319 [Dictyostelium cf. discoideum]
MVNAIAIIKGLGVEGKIIFSQECEVLEHYNPQNREHGSPLDSERHIGDLGNIEDLSNGVAIISIRDTVMSLFGIFSVIGRTIVIHADRDDYGRGNFPDSKTTGHSGKRVGCLLLQRFK